MNEGGGRDILPRVIEDAVARRKRQNLSAPRVAVSAVTPSIRSFAQAIDRQRRDVERVPLLQGARADLVATCQALDAAEVAAVAVAIDDAAAELSRFAEAARESSVPVLRADLVLEEFQVYESRAAGADAVLLWASLLDEERLSRLVSAARSTHMSPCVACASAAEIARAAAARAEVIALSAAADGSAPEALLAQVPKRAMVLVLPARLLDGAPAAAAVEPLRGRADAVLDADLGRAADPAAEFRRLLSE